MDTPERLDGALTPWTPPSVPGVHAGGWEDPHASGHGDAPAGKAFNIKIIGRALRRHWWQILAIWVVTSGVLGYLAITRIKPTYDAFSWLEVSPASRSLIAQSSVSSGDSFGPYLDTQVLLVTSPEVVSDAILDPNVAGLPRIRAMAEPETELRKEISVVPQKGTHLIVVKMTGENPSEVSAIVNAVVKSYTSKAITWTDAETQIQIERLKALKRTYEQEFNKKIEDFNQLARKYGTTTNLDIPKRDTADAEKEGESASPGQINKQRITMEQFRKYNMELANVRINRLQAEAAVNYLATELKNRGNVAIAAGKGLSEEQIEAIVKNEFQNNPTVIQALQALQAAEDRLAQATKRIKNRMDPVRKTASENYDDAEDRYKKLWETMYPELRKRVAATGSSAPVVANAEDISREGEMRAARLKLNELKIHEKLVEEMIKTAEVEADQANDREYQVAFARQDASLTRDLLTTVDRNLKQLEYEAQGGTRIKIIAPAKASRSPSSNNRMKVAAAIPVLMLALASGLFILLEIRSGRVADPDDLPSKIKVGVIGVVPPLPSIGSQRSLPFLKGPDEKRKVEEFVQSLDHLRVTICAHRPGEKTHRRCILITSACGGEGKTTLAAQLAGRCANAGLMTLLVDADLRRPSLGELLEVPEGPGLVDVLSGEASPESAMVVIGNAGGFHLLPAGTSGQDPSRLLHGERLGHLIGQFRETFDIVIIDAPPVLAVPDALLLGRWTDGAILAVRHDTSRYPLVERANRRLTSVGIKVLGAVINGVRSVEATYGYGYSSYRYTPYAAVETPGGAVDNTLE